MVSTSVWESKVILFQALLTGALLWGIGNKLKPLAELFLLLAQTKWWVGSRVFFRWDF